MYQVINRNSGRLISQHHKLTRAIQSEWKYERLYLEERVDIIDTNTGQRVDPDEYNTAAGQADPYKIWN
jgi:hypothetical protein